MRLGRGCWSGAGVAGAEGGPGHEWSVRTCAGEVDVVVDGDRLSGGVVASVVGASTVMGSTAAGGGGWECDAGAWSPKRVRRGTAVGSGGKDGVAGVYARRKRRLRRVRRPEPSTFTLY